MNQQTTIDIAGVVIEISDAEFVKLRTGLQKIRKYVTIIDETLYAVAITLWGELCEKHTIISVGDVIVVQRGRISEFGGKSVNAADDHALLQINGEDERTLNLKRWFYEFLSTHKQNFKSSLKFLT